MYLQIPSCLPSAQNVSAVCFLAPPGAGKTTTIRAIASLLPSGSTCHGDTSDALDWGMKSDTPLGGALRVAQTERVKGNLIDDRLVMSVCSLWIDDLFSRNSSSQVFFWSGYPRSPMQIGMLQYFRTFALVYLDVPPDVAVERCVKRWRETPPQERRPDDPKTEAEVRTLFWERRYPAFLKNSAPVLHLLESRTVRVNGLKPIHEQVSYILDSLVVMHSRTPHPNSKNAPARIRDRVSAAFPAHPVFPTELHEKAQFSLANPRHPLYADTAQAPKPAPWPNGPLRSVEDRFFPLMTAGSAPA